MGRAFDISSASSLPTWTPPKSEDRAVVEIIVFCTALGENVYQIGKHLLWVKDTVRHGEFGRWVEDHLPMSQRTAQRFMKFARDCEGQDRLLEYHPEKSRKAKVRKLPRQNVRKYIKQIAREIEQKRHGDGFGPSQKKQEREDRKELSKVLSRLYYKWGGETLEGWIREIWERL